jgi:hypothetical protein
MIFRPTIILYLGLALGIQLGVSACSTTPGPTPDPVEQAFSRSQETVITGIDEGFEDSEGLDQYVVQARLNPCRCEAPRHEIYAHGRWTRIFLEGDEALVADIDEKLTQSAQNLDLTSLAIKGIIDGEKSTPQGIKYLVFEVEEIEPPDDDAPEQ